MTDFTTDQNQNPRVNQQRITPTAIQPAFLSQITLSNTTAGVQGPFSLANGSSLQITSFIINNANPKFKIGTLPYGIVFLEGSPSLSKIIGSPQGVPASTGYNLFGPIAMPQFTPIATNINGSITVGGNDGNNIVFITELVNNTGGSKNIYYLSNSRVYTTTGGSITGSSAT